MLEHSLVYVPIDSDLTLPSSSEACAFSICGLNVVDHLIVKHV